VQLSAAADEDFRAMPAKVGEVHEQFAATT
jgi:hypothetical protein